MSNFRSPGRAAGSGDPCFPTRREQRPARVAARRSPWALATGAFVLVGVGGACAEREHVAAPVQPCCPCRPDGRGATLLDERLMALLSAARGYHHQADLHQRQGRPAEAVAALRKLLRLGLDARWPEAEEARLDAAARLGKLLAEQGAWAEAERLVRAQLATGPRASFYAANLHAVHGELLEARVHELEKGGDPAAAREVAREAIAAFGRAIAINEGLLAALQADDRARSPQRSGAGEVR